MNKELEDAIKVLEKLKDELDKLFNITYINNTKERNAMEIILNYIENSISKEKVKEYIKILDEEFYILDREIDISKYGLDDRGKIFAMQEIGWIKGKLEELLEGK